MVECVYNLLTFKTLLFEYIQLNEYIYGILQDRYSNTVCALYDPFSAEYSSHFICFNQCLRQGVLCQKWPNHQGQLDQKSDSSSYHYTNVLVSCLLQGNNIDPDFYQCADTSASMHFAGKLPGRAIASRSTPHSIPTPHYFAVWGNSWLNNRSFVSRTIPAASILG